MIGIFQNLDLALQYSHLKEKYWEKIQKIINGRRKNNVVIKIYVGKTQYDFKDVVLYDFDDLNHFVELLNGPSKVKAIGYYNKKKIKLDFKRYYENFRKNYGVWFIKCLGLTVCPYCNRDYLNLDDRKTAAEFDHFFPKSKYKYLSVAISNLVPCCHTCNHEKSNDTISLYSPYNLKFKTDELCHFEFSFLNKDDNYNIKLVSDNVIFNNNIIKFKLDKRYSIHTNIVREYLKKSYLLNQFYIKNIEELIGVTINQYENVLFNISDNEHYYLEPLSKFKTDLSNAIIEYSKIK